MTVADVINNNPLILVALAYVLVTLIQIVNFAIYSLIKRIFKKKETTPQNYPIVDPRQYSPPQEAPQQYPPQEQPQQPQQHQQTPQQSLQPVKNIPLPPKPFNFSKPSSYVPTTKLQQGGKIGNDKRRSNGI